MIYVWASTYLFICFGVLRWVLAELAEEVAYNEGSEAVEEENLTHEPEVNIRHFEVAVVWLAFEVDSLPPDEDDRIVDNQGQERMRDAKALLKTAQGQQTEDQVADVQGE